MLQSPEQDGPPDLDSYFASMQSGRQTATGPPVTLGTGRARMEDHGGDATAAAQAALRAAAGGLDGVAQLCHTTFAVDVDADAAATALRAELGDVPLIGRVVDRRGAAGVIEVLILTSAAPGGITVASATAPAGAAPDAACDSALREATAQAISALSPESPASFLLFAHDSGAGAGIDRAAIAAAAPGAVAYGGGAATVFAPGAGADASTAVVAAVPGSLSFLLSAVIKNWAQPKYVEPLSYMSPSYVDDPYTDLLTAIRYDDWDKFVWCLEEAKVPVNYRWEKKQNQIPLLAACARLRIRMVEYLLEHGADVLHRNDGGFTAAMYTRMLTEHDRDVVGKQLRMLEAAGASTSLTEDEANKLKTATNGRIVE